MVRSMRPLHLLGLLLCAAVPACGQGRGTPAISRDAFVDSYVALRVAGLSTEVGDLSDSARSRILTEQGVTEQDLLDFVAARGTDVVFMRDLWNEIEQRLDSVPLPSSAVTP